MGTHSLPLHFLHTMQAAIIQEHNVQVTEAEGASSKDDARLHGTATIILCEGVFKECTPFLSSCHPSHMSISIFLCLTPVYD